MLTTIRLQTFVNGYALDISIILVHFVDLGVFISLVKIIQLFTYLISAITFYVKLHHLRPQHQRKRN